MAKVKLEKNMLTQALTDGIQFITDNYQVTDNLTIEVYQYGMTLVVTENDHVVTTIGEHKKADFLFDFSKTLEEYSNVFGTYSEIISDFGMILWNIYIHFMYYRLSDSTIKELVLNLKMELGECGHYGDYLFKQYRDNPSIMDEYNNHNTEHQSYNL